MNCRHCGSSLNLLLIDLGTAPPSNAYLTESQLHYPEKWYPLRVLVCEKCWLVQTEDFARADMLFSEDYAYFSSFSTSWLRHSHEYVNMIVKRLDLNKTSLIVEIASNDGYLLQYVNALGIPCLGIEPTKSTASAARKKGLTVLEKFFSLEFAQQLIGSGLQADLIVANNVLAHVPDINDFASGCATLLKKDGVATFEFHYLLSLIENNLFDTIYHEHYSYLSLTSVVKLLEFTGLGVFDVELLPTQGGSLRIYAQRLSSSIHEESASVTRLLQYENDKGMKNKSFYRDFRFRIRSVTNDFLSFLIECQRKDLKVGAYGAAAKGNTLLNYAGIRSDLIPYVVDINPSKQGKYMPGSRIPIVSEDHLKKDKPDIIVILPWNLKEEIMTQIIYVGEWGAKFVTALPKMQVL